MSIELFWTLQGEGPTGNPRRAGAGVGPGRGALGVPVEQVELVVRNPPANAGDIKDTGWIPGLGRSMEEGMATHFSRGAWWATVRGVAKRPTTEVT